MKERELGFRVFDRTKKPISLTREGEIYIDMLEEMMQSENNMRHRIGLLSQATESSISVGSSCYAAYYLLPTVCGVFYRRYPSVEVRLDIGNVSEGETLSQKLDKNALDILFAYDYNKQKYRGIPILEERMIVAMRKDLVKPALSPYALSREMLLSGNYSQDKECSDLSLFHSVPFLSFSPTGSTGRYMLDLLGYYSVSTHSIENARHSGVHYNMMCAGLGAILTGDSSVVVSGYASDDIVYFVFPKEISTRRLYAVLRKNDVEEENVKNFLEIARELVAQGKGLSLFCP